MKKEIEITETQNVWNGYVKLNKMRFRVPFQQKEGFYSLEREIVFRGNAAAALVYNREENVFLFVRQFRVPPFLEHIPFLLEIPAGMVEKNEMPAESIKRELAEEIGFEVKEVKPISDFWVSPGVYTERMFLFYVEVSESQHLYPGGGRDVEKEDIEIVKMAPEEAIQKLDQNHWNDAKTVVALQWWDRKIRKS